LRPAVTDFFVEKDLKKFDLWRPLWVISGRSRRKKSFPLYSRKRTFATAFEYPLSDNTGHGPGDFADCQHASSEIKNYGW
jgi:hypothetical protein